MQLQAEYEKIKRLSGEIIAVHREENLEAKGLVKTANSSKAGFVLLSDLGAKSTPRYSQNGFVTYIIDGKGVIRAVLPGTKIDRPTGREISAKFEELFKK